MRMIRCFTILLVIFVPRCANAQVLRIGSDSRRTIEATTTEKISVPADSAIVKVGFNHVADTKDAAYNERVRMGNKIVKALTGAGIPTEEIQTEALTVGREEEGQRGMGSPTKTKLDQIFSGTAMAHSRRRCRRPESGRHRGCCRR